MFTKYMCSKFKHKIVKLPKKISNQFQLNSVDDHRLEMMGFCWENGYHGVLSDDGEMALFSPPRYFSAHSMKLSMNVSEKKSFGKFLYTSFK